MRQELKFDNLTGKKVILRQFDALDITPEYVFWLNDPDVVRYSNQRFIQHTDTSCRQYLSSFANTENLFLTIRRKSDDVAIGTMTAYVMPQHETVDIGIMIGNRTVWGEGMGQDAWNTLLSWFIRKRQIRKATAGTMRCNTAMVRIMENSGMGLEAVRTEQELLNGMPQDILYYSKFRACESGSGI